MSDWECTAQNHNFVARYNEGPMTYPIFKEQIGSMVVTENRDGQYKTYIYDIIV